MKKMGYIIGLVIGIPLFILIANFFFFRGNSPSETEIVNYIKNSDVDTIILPQNVQMRSEQYIKGFSRRGRPSGFLDKYPFYDKKFNKHFVMLIINFLDNNSVMRSFVLRRNEGGDKISVRINQIQLNNPKYGTKENPIPVFPIDLIRDSGVSTWEARGYPEDPFHVSDELNMIFVEQYLKHFMPKEEFKEMFKK